MAQEAPKASFCDGEQTETLLLDVAVSKRGIHAKPSRPIHCFHPWGRDPSCVPRKKGKLICIGLLRSGIGQDDQDRLLKSSYEGPEDLRRCCAFWPGVADRKS